MLKNSNSTTVNLGGSKVARTVNLLFLQLQLIRYSAPPRAWNLVFAL
jgi:hypothetical protein